MFCRVNGQTEIKAEVGPCTVIGFFFSVNHMWCSFLALYYISNLNLVNLLSWIDQTHYTTGCVWAGEKGF